MPKVCGVCFWRVLLLPLLAVFGLAPPSSAQPQTPAVSSWLKPEPAVFKTIKDQVAAEALPAYSNKDCSPKTKFITVPGNILKVRPEVSYETCAIQTAYGQHSASDGNIRLHDTSLAGPVKTSGGATRLTSAIPNSNHIMYFGGGLYGTYHYVIKDFAKNINTAVQPDGSISHQLKPGVDGDGIKDSSGALIAFSETRFSDNGKWMVGDSHLRGMTRVNIETGETLVFGGPYNHAVGTRPFFVSAISSDGRYVFSAAQGYATMKIYDLSTCVLNADRTKQANCQSRDLLPEAKGRFNDFKGVYHAQFSTNYSLRLYLNHKSGAYGYFTLTAPGEVESRLGYLAAGDSFASGEGAFNYKPGTNVREPFNGCHLSLLSYPYLLAGKSNLDSAQSIACSGARVKDIVNGGYREETAQAKGKNSPANDDEILSNYLPGYRPQLSFIKASKPANLTISVGGNDIGFSKILLACLAPGTCYDTPQEKLNLAYTINQQFNQLVSTYESIRQSASTGAHIYVIGYPLLADPAGNCALNVHLNQQEMELANQIVVYLNSVIKQASLKAGFSYANVEQALAGYRLCETKSANVAVHGLTAGDDKTFSLPMGSNYSLEGYFTGKESFHPNQLGHQLLGQAIFSATNNFSALNPDPVTSSAPPDLNGTSLAKSATTTLLPRRIIFEETMTKSVLVRSQTHKLAAEGLQPNSNVTFLANSKPTIIGSYQVSAEGGLDLEFSLPSTIQYGTHVIHLQAKNKAGEDIDIQKLVYIAHTLDDFDGDNISNHQEKCLFADSANTDVDLDTTDDACDGMIGEPLVLAPPVTSAPQPLAGRLRVRSNAQKPSQIQLAGSAEQTPVTRLQAHEPIESFSINRSPTLGVATRSTSSESQKAVVRAPGNDALKPLAALIIGLIFGLCALSLAYGKWRKRA